MTMRMPADGIAKTMGKQLVTGIMIYPARQDQSIGGGAVLLVSARPMITALSADSLCILHATR